MIKYFPQVLSVAHGDLGCTDTQPEAGVRRIGKVAKGPAKIRVLAGKLQVQGC